MLIVLFCHVVLAACILVSHGWIRFAKYWLSVGAQPSETVKRLLGNAGILPEYVHPVSVQTAVPRKDRPKKVRKKKKKK